jgi:hypothetical protein
MKAILPRPQNYTILANEVSGNALEFRFQDLVKPSWVFLFPWAAAGDYVYSSGQEVLTSFYLIVSARSCNDDKNPSSR